MRRGSLIALSAFAALAGQAARAETVRPVLTIDDLLDRVCAAPLVLAASANQAARDVQAQEAAQPETETTAPPPDAQPTDDKPLAGRRRPGRVEEFPAQIQQENKGAVRAPPPEAFPKDEIPVPDRWRLAGALGVSRPRLLDPYNQNILKGDIPLPRKWLGEGWFVNASFISDTVIEPRSFPIPVSVQTTQRAGSLDVFGKDTSLVLAQTFIVAASLVKGSTAYKPPEYEFRVALAGQDNYVDVPERRVLDVRPSHATHRNDAFIGVQEAFLDYHIRNVSDRYDFDSIRVGIQPFSSDFRGFLFQDNQLGVRLFGNRDNNRFQYNLAAFWRLEKDTNSGLNDVTQRIRDDWVFIGNVYRQDLPVPGFTSQLTVVYNRNREGNEIYVDKNGFPQRPALIGNLRGRDYDVTYLGYNGDGHWGRYNLTASAYYAIGEDRNSIFTSRKADIRSFFVAVEPSMDFDWVRVRLNGLYASGDKKPYDNTERGFDAVFENPQFAGSDTSYWIRQTIPFAGGGRLIAINNRNGVLNAIRPTKEEGQSNFNNPGTTLWGAGADFDVTPELRVTTNINHLGFVNTAVLQVDRQEGSIPKSIGWDASVSTIWRPKMTQNIVVRVSGAVLDPGKGFKDLFTNAERNKRYYSVLANIIFTY
ncbi:MAG TPA: hypothetical protein VF495_26600 [Phenylobacterium sp.]